MQNFKDFFNFNKRQERGVFMLSLILIMLIVLNYFAPEFAHKSTTSIAHPEYLEQLQLSAIERSQNKNQYTLKKHKDSVIISVNSKFDPNSIEFNSLIEMGLPVFVSNNIIKYRKSGGRFSNKSDLSKIYGMKKEWYLILSPFIQINKRKERLHKERKTVNEQISLKKNVQRYLN